MIALVLQLVACIALACAAAGWWLKHSRGESAHRFLLPFIMAAGVAGGVVLVTHWWHFHTLLFGGSPFTMVLDGKETDIRWTLPLFMLIPLLPLSGLWEVVGKRPEVMGLPALFVACPSVIYLVF